MTLEKTKQLISQKVGLTIIIILALASGLAILWYMNSIVIMENTPSPLKKPVTTGDITESTNPLSLRLALIRLNVQQSLDPKITALNQKINTVVSDKGSVVDVLVTPEYSFTSTLQNQYPEYALDFSCDENFNNCTVSSAGGTYSETVLETVNSLTLIASSNQFYIFLGTVIERFDTAGNPEITDPYVYFNDLVIINPQGQLSLKRKTNGDWESDCAWGSNCHYAIEQEALSTVRSFNIINRFSESITSFPIICGERFHQPMLDYALNLGLADLDILIGPEREGDTPYEEITEAIQNGTWTEEMFGWDWGIEDGFIQTYIGSGLLRPNAYLAVAEGGTATAGLINLVTPPAPVTEYEQNSNYMFGLVQYCEDGTIEEQCAETKPKYCQEHQLINNCEECGCPSGQICRPDGSCKKTTNKYKVPTN